MYLATVQANLLNRLQVHFDLDGYAMMIQHLQKGSRQRGGGYVVKRSKQQATNSHQLGRLHSDDTTYLERQWAQQRPDPNRLEINKYSSSQ